MDRFWDKVQKTETCWNWIASKDIEGYGNFSMVRNGKKKQCRAHRIAYELTYGSIPEGQCVLHKCDNTSCVNPEHLFIGSQLENIADKVTKGRQSHWGPSNPGEKNAAAKLTLSQVEEIRARYAQGTSQNAMAKEYGVGRSQIGRIVRKESW